MEKYSTVLSILLGVALLGGGFLWYRLVTFEKTTTSTVASLHETIQNKDVLIASTTMRIATLEGLLTETQTLLQQTIDEKDTLSMNLNDEKEKNDAFQNQIDKIGSTIGTLDKLAKTDKELLQKYSKVYFLNENYIPAKLRELDKKYLYNETVPKFLKAEVLPFYDDMVQAAQGAGIKIWVVSAYRSFDEQKDLKGAYTVAYGMGANTFSADQGYSEHQLGTTLDLTTENLNGGLNGFDATPAYAWLQKNAYKYGFILSYPSNNSYYVFEPWHWRFVGTKLAKDLRSDGKNFYDLDQREIDVYLISLFD